MTQFPKTSLRILVKAILLFVIFNYAFVFVPDSALWQLSLYNTLLPGQTRFPLENDLNLMFDTHEISASPGRENEYKVVMLGDSATWGFYLDPTETFSSVINASNTVTCKQKTIHLYNLGYPSLSVLKDLIILQRAVTYRPDLIVWNITLRSMLRKSEQNNKLNVIVNNNNDIAQELIDKYGLTTQLDSGIDPVKRPSFQNKSYLARRDKIARFINYQLNGIRWQAAGEHVDKDYPPLGMDVKADDTFDDILPPTLHPNLLQFDVLNAGVLMAGTTPIIIINEPIQIVNGENSGIRYNKIYPRWAYDQYREMMTLQSEQHHWTYVDLWNVIPPTEFSNTPIHHTAKGDQIFSRTIKSIILKNACP